MPIESLTYGREYQRTREAANRRKPWEPQIRYSLQQEALDHTRTTRRVYGDIPENGVILAVLGFDGVDIPFEAGMRSFPVSPNSDRATSRKNIMALY